MSHIRDYSSRQGAKPACGSAFLIPSCTPQGARVLLMDGTAVESAFALLLTKVTKPSLGNLLICAVSGTITDKKEVYAYIGKGG